MSGLVPGMSGLGCPQDKAALLASGAFLSDDRVIRRMDASIASLLQAAEAYIQY